MNALTLVTANDDAPTGGVQSRVRFRAVQGTVYRIAVDGYRVVPLPVPTGSVHLSSTCA